MTPIVTALERGLSIAMTTEQSGALYRLLTWLSPSYPVGAFAYSQGLEGAITQGYVRDPATTRGWIEDSLTAGCLWSDSVIFARAHAAANDDNADALAAICTFARAFQPTAELKLETLALGNAFLGVTRQTWPCEALARLEQMAGPNVVYPVAVAAAAAGHCVALEPSLEGWLHAAVSSQISAAIRLVPLGQSEGQRILADLEKVIAATALKARQTELEDLTTCTLMAEICSMSHETQHTRLFRS
jgi:urease accessory protein